METPQLKLPPLGNQTQASNKDRVFRTALSGSDYVKLEQDAMLRGLKPFSYTKIIMTNYLAGECVMLDEFPDDTAKQLRAFLAQKKQKNAAPMPEIKE